MRIHLTVVVVCLTLISINSSASTGSVRSYGSETAIQFSANSGEKTDAMAGHLPVPENRHNPDSRMIRINYVRFPATGVKKGPPIIYLAGGPGGSGIATAKWRRFPLFMALREYGDVIALDQRGTGESQRAEPCQSSITVPLTERLAPEQITRLYRRAATECLANWRRQGVDVYGYTSEQNAWDIDALRRHFGAEKVVLWGISYGSHLAMAAMKQFPERIDKVILASAEGLDQTVKLPANTDRYFADVQAVINRQALKSVIPDLPGLMRRVHKKLARNPIELEIPGRDGGNTAMLFQTYHMQALASRMIADPGQYLAMLLHTYVALDANDTELLADILSRGMFADRPIRFDLMSLAMDLASGISTSRLAKVKQQAQTAILGEALNFPMPHLNRLDDKLDLGDSFRADPQNPIPTLLFTGSLDGRTYPSGQREAVRGLKNLTQVTVKNAGHNLYTASPEVLTRMQAFLAGAPIDTADIVLALPRLELAK